MLRKIIILSIVLIICILIIFTTGCVEAPNSQHNCKNNPCMIACKSKQSQEKCAEMTREIRGY